MWRGKRLICPQSNRWLRRGAWQVSKFAIGEAVDESVRGAFNHNFNMQETMLLGLIMLLALACFRRCRLFY